MCWERIFVDSHERLIVTRNGCFERLLLPGDYHVALTPQTSLVVEKHDVRDVFVDNTAVAAMHLDAITSQIGVIETSETQVAMVYVDEQLFSVLIPASRLLFWRDSGHQVTAEIVEVIADPVDAFVCSPGL